MAAPNPAETGPDRVLRPPRRPHRALRRFLSAALCVTVLAIVSAASYAFLIKPEVRTQAAACVRPQPAQPVAAVKPAAAGKAAPPQQAVKLTPDKVVVNVYNATTRAGLAGTVATELRRRGFKVNQVDNDPLDRRIPGLAELRRGPAGEAAAAVVLPHLGAPTAVVDRRRDATVDVVVGARFTALRGQATASPAAATASTRPAC